MLGGCIGIDVHEVSKALEAAGLLFFIMLMWLFQKKIRRIAHVTFRKGQKEWAWLSDAQIQDIVGTSPAIPAHLI
jgi:hypothetical protein